MPTTQEDFDALETALKSSNIQDAKQKLQNFDVTATDKNGWTCLMSACRYSYQSSSEVVKLIFDKIDEAGGNDLITSQLTATTDKGLNCLMIGCSKSSSPEVMKLIFEKIDEIGGKHLLKTLLAATTDKGSTCLMLGCSNSSSPEIVQLIFDKIDEAGGPDLVKSQLTATSDSGSTCLMFACFNSSSSEIVKLVFEKIICAGGKEMLINQVTVTNSDGYNCLMFSCRGKSSSPEVVKLFAVALFELTQFNQEYAKLTGDDQKKLQEKTGIDSPSWTPDAVSLAEVKQILEGGNGEELTNNSTGEGASNNTINKKTVTTIQPATIRKYFDFFDYARTGLMEKSSMCAAIVACFPMSSTIVITERVKKAKCKETNKEKLDFDDFCSILNDIL